MSHNCTVNLYPGMLRVKIPREMDRVKPAKRGSITKLTRAARKRMIEATMQFTFETVKFVTLTYPSEWDCDPVLWKVHLRRWRSRLERRYGALKAFWRLEFQKRGAPHYHVLLFDAPWIDREWLAKSWYECVGSGDPKHLKAGTQIKFVASKDKERGRVIYYVSKYIGKNDTGSRPPDAWTGRYWGRWNIKTLQPITFDIDREHVELVRYHALASRVHPSEWSPSLGHGYAVFGGSPGNCNFLYRFFDQVKGTRLAPLVLE